MSTLDVVLGPRQVEVAARASRRAETRRRLYERLLSAFVRDVRFANALTCRIAMMTRAGAVDPNLVEAIDDALSQLRPVGVTAQELGEIERREPFAGVIRKAMNELDSRLAAAGFIDERLSGSVLGAALSRASPHDVLRVVGATKVRASHITRWERDATWWKALTTAIRRAGGEVSVELPVVSKGVDASRAADPFEVVVETVARLLDEAPVEVSLSQSVLGDLSFVEEVPASARERVAVVRAIDHEAQARAALLAIKGALADGTATERMAIIVPHGFSSAARTALGRHFDDAGLSVVLGMDPFEGTLAHVAMQALAAADGGLDRHDVAALLRARALDARVVSGLVEGRAARAALYDLADVLERTPATTVSGEAPAARLVATARARSGSPDVVERRATVAARVAAALTNAASATTRVERVRATRAMFAQLGLGARPGAAAADLLARDEPGSPLSVAELEAHARDGRAFEALALALDDIEWSSLALRDDSPCTGEVFRREIAHAMRARGSSGSSGVGAIRAVHADELAGEAMDLVVVLDATAGILPRRPSSVQMLPASHARAQASSELVDLACALDGARRVVFCHRLTDEDGSPLAPSPLVSWLTRGGIKSSTVHAAPLMGPPATPYERTLALVAVAPEHAAELTPHAARVATVERDREALHAGRNAGTMLRGAETLRTLLDVETGGGATPMSVTAVERTLRCKFQGFAAQVLGALDDDPRTEDLPDRREEGILVHDALAAAFVAAGERWSERPRDGRAIAEAARRASDGVLARSGGAVVQATLEQIRLEVSALVALALEDDTWDFALAEQSFGHREGWPPFLLEDGDVHITLRGRIDRIDAAHDASAVRVIDYKRRVTLPPNVDIGATTIQVPVYALVARRALDKKRTGGRYLSTAKPVRDSTPAFEEKLAELVHEAADGSTEVTRLVLAVIKALREGDVVARPAAPKWCAQCGLDGACRRPRFAVALEDEE